MKHINAAYAVLSDADRRRQHDGWIAEQEGTPAATPRHKEPPPARSYDDVPLRHTVVNWVDLSPDLRQLLCGRSRSGESVLFARTTSWKAHVVALGAAAVGAWLAVGMVGPKKLPFENLIVVVGIIAVAIAVVSYLSWDLYRVQVEGVRRGVGRTATHFFEVREDTVSLWPLFGIKQFKMTHHRVNGGYAHSLIEFDHVAGGARAFKVQSEAEADALFESVHRSLQQLYHGDPADYFMSLARSTLNALRASPTVSHAWVKRGSGCVALGLAVSAALGFLVLSPSNDAAPRFNGSPQAPTQTQMVPLSPTHISPPPPPVVAARTPSTAAKMPPPGKVPRTGWLQLPKGAALVAPLSITTPAGGGYYFKLITPQGKNVGSLYARGGETVSVEAPLGHFRIRYAYGPTWYSTEQLFGEETRYAELDTDLNFSVSRNETSGFQITLVKQVNGNLPEHEVSAETF